MIAGLVRDFTAKFSVRNCMDETLTFKRRWIRDAEFCENVTRLRRSGCSYSLIREKLRKDPRYMDLKVSDEVLRAAIIEGPISFFSESAG